MGILNFDFRIWGKGSVSSKRQAKRPAGRIPGIEAG